MTFQKINIPKGHSTLARLVLYQSRPLQSKNNSNCHQPVSYKKKFDLFYIY